MIGFLAKFLALIILSFAAGVGAAHILFAISGG